MLLLSYLRSNCHCSNCISLWREDFLINSHQILVLAGNLTFSPPSPAIYCTLRGLTLFSLLGSDFRGRLSGYLYLNKKYCCDNFLIGNRAFQHQPEHSQQRSQSSSINIFRRNKATIEVKLNHAGYVLLFSLMLCKSTQCTVESGAGNSSVRIKVNIHIVVIILVFCMLLAIIRWSHTTFYILNGFNISEWGFYSYSQIQIWTGIVNPLVP